MTTQPISLRDERDKGNESMALLVSAGRPTDLVLEAPALPVASAAAGQGAPCASWGAVHDLCLGSSSTSGTILIREAS